MYSVEDLFYGKLELPFRKLRQDYFNRPDVKSTIQLTIYYNGDQGWQNEIDVLNSVCESGCNWCEKRLIPRYTLTAEGNIWLDENGLPQVEDYIEVTNTLEQIQTFMIDHYIAIYSFVPLTQQVIDTLTDIHFQNDQYSTAKKNFSVLPSVDAAEILMPSMTEEKVEQLKGLQQAFKDIDNRPVTNESRVRWERFKPDDPRCMAYVNGLETRLPRGIYAVTSESGPNTQKTLDAFKEDLTKQLLEAVSSGKVKTPEHARELYYEIVNAGIKDNAIFSTPELNQVGRVVFADKNSWLWWTASLAEEVLAPVMARIMFTDYKNQQNQEVLPLPTPAPTPVVEQKVVKRRQSRKGVYLTTENARKDKCKTILDYWKPI